VRGASCRYAHDLRALPPGGPLAGEAEVATALQQQQLASAPCKAWCFGIRVRAVTMSVSRFGRYADSVLIGLCKKMTFRFTCKSGESSSMAAYGVVVRP